MKIKLTKPGFETLTGPLHDVDFVNGEATVTPQIAARIAANIEAVVLDDEGEVVEQAGPATAVPVTTRAAAERNHIPE